MPQVRVIVFDAENVFQRISSPEDVFLVEALDADGSGSADLNYIRISPVSGSGVLIGREGIGTFVSGVLSGNFITGTFYGDGSQLRGVVHQLNSLTGSFNLVAGPNTTIVVDDTVFPTQIVLSSSVPPTGSDELVKVTSNDTTPDYLFSKLVAGPNIVIVEQGDGGDEKVVISGTAAGGGISGSEHRDLNQLVHIVAEDYIEEFIYQGNMVLSATMYQSDGTTKIREELYSHAGSRFLTGTTQQYDESGIPIVGEKMTETYIYQGNNISVVTGTLT